MKRRLRSMALPHFYIASGILLLNELHFVENSCWYILVFPPRL